MYLHYSDKDIPSPCILFDTLPYQYLRQHEIYSVVTYKIKFAFKCELPNSCNHIVYICIHFIQGLSGI